MIIVGAGLAGLIAGNLIPQSKVVEASKTLNQHRAVLRFRSSAVGDAVGVPFKQVTVRKGIYIDGQFVEPTIQLANQYSLKVVGSILDRSIWNIEPSQRWIAPEDFTERLALALGSRLTLGEPFDFVNYRDVKPVISTAPLPVIDKMFFSGEQEFRSRSIWVARYRIVGASAYQTIYYPDRNSEQYRASITGNVLSIEYMDKNTSETPMEVFDSFGFLREVEVKKIDEGFQRYGKIVEIDERVRRNMILILTKNFGIYSLGRFATWRNILLDDVLKDISQIKKLISSDPYSRALLGSKS